MKAYFLWLVTVLVSSMAGLRGYAQAAEENAQVNRLSPHKAILCEEVRYIASPVDLGLAVPRDKNDLLLAVFFSGVMDSPSVHAKELNWTVRPPGPRTDDRTMIGVGFLNSRNEVQFVGAVTKGEISHFRGGKKPLLALVYVVPENTAEFILVDPNGNGRTFGMSRTWKPGKDNVLHGFGLTRLEFGSEGGKDWKTRPLQQRKQ